MATIQLSQPFLKTMNGEAVNELEVDFSKITTKQYIESYKNIDSKEIDLIAYGKIGFRQAKNLIAYAIDCIPEMLNSMPLLPDYQKLEKMCFIWSWGVINKQIDESVKFEKISVDQYIKIRSDNALNDLDSVSAKASETTRRDLIACATGKTIEELETMPVEEYIPLDIKCASFFSELL